MSGITKPIPFDARCAYVAVDPDDLVLPWTTRYFLKDAKNAASEWLGESWDEMKRRGFHIERCTITHGCNCKAG